MSELTYQAGDLKRFLSEYGEGLYSTVAMRDLLYAETVDVIADIMEVMWIDRIKDDGKSVVKTHLHAAISRSMRDSNVICNPEGAH